MDESKQHCRTDGGREPTGATVADGVLADRAAIGWASAEVGRTVAVRHVIYSQRPADVRVRDGAASRAPLYGIQGQPVTVSRPKNLSTTGRKKRHAETAKSNYGQS